MTQPETLDGPVVATEANEMMRTAIALHRFVKEVNENGRYDAKSDVLGTEIHGVVCPD